MPTFRRAPFGETIRVLLGRGCLVLASSATFACGGASETSGGAACVYGEVISCQLDAGQKGTMECLPDLTAYGPCRPVSDAGILADAAPAETGTRSDAR